ncbi:MAG: class I SAM-dependent methyltransferase [Ardenticatenales bacterium]|nr:class I SAM-dependent methyltransferase [Ardenticatenales bacterium]
MHRTTLERLTAPGGGDPLRLVSVARMQGDDISEGAALSPTRGLYPIHDGILNLLPGGRWAISPAQASNLLLPAAWWYEPLWRTRALSLMSGEPFSLERERALFDELLGEPTGTLWLDLAASTALYGRWLAPRLAPGGGEVLALDLSLPMLREAQRRSQAEGQRNISFVLGRGETLPFATATLDGVLCGGSLNEFGAQGATRVLKEVARALRPGGKALFMHLRTTEQPRGARLQRYLLRPSGIAFWDRPTTNRLFAEAGLRVVESRDAGIVAFTVLSRA